jgi:hypothetical protein
MEIKITKEQANQITAILNELPIRELNKVQAIIKIFNEGIQDNEVVEEAETDEN